MCEYSIAKSSDSRLRETLNFRQYFYSWLCVMPLSGVNPNVAISETLCTHLLFCFWGAVSQMRADLQGENEMRDCTMRYTIIILRVFESSVIKI